MNIYQKEHPFWGVSSPLSSLTGAAIIILGSSRLSYAVILASAVIWVFCFTVLTVKIAGDFIPGTGKPVLLSMITMLWTVVFYVLLSFLTPVLASELYLFICLVPVVCIASDICERTETHALHQSLFRAFKEALILGFLCIGLSLIREPFGFGVLSWPGSHGIIELFGSRFSTDVSIKLVSTVSGALILFGYLIALYRTLRKMYADFTKQKDTL